MDSPAEISQRLERYAAALQMSHAQHGTHAMIEQWLTYWDDEDSTFGNLRNIEHWLSQASGTSIR